MTPPPVSAAALEPTQRTPDARTGGVHHFGSVTAVFDDLVLYVPIRHYVGSDRPLFQRRIVTADEASIELVDETGQVYAASTHRAMPTEQPDIEAFPERVPRLIDGVIATLAVLAVVFVGMVVYAVAQYADGAWTLQ